MNTSVPYAYVIVLVFVWRIISQRKGFSFRLFENIEIINKKSLYLEKIIMFLFPVIIAIIHSLEMISSGFTGMLLVTVILVDFLLQYLFESMQWIKTNNKYSKELLWWAVLAVIIIIIV